MSDSNNTQELDVNKLERIIADHNKEMRTDMASEITGGTRSKSITDVITVKAILDWHNKQMVELLDRLENLNESQPDSHIATFIEADRKKHELLGAIKESERHIYAWGRERTKVLKQELEKL